MVLRNKEPSKASQKLIKEAEKKLPKGATTLQKSILKAFGEKLSDEDAADLTPFALADMAMSHTELSLEKGEGDAKVRVYCPETHDEHARKTIIDIVSDDRAFLVDSIAAEINTQNFLIDFLYHPILYVKYGPGDKVQSATGEYNANLARHSHIHIYIKEVLPKEEREKLEQRLNRVIEDVYFANRDWKEMLAEIKQARNDLAIASSRVNIDKIGQYVAFLDYLYDNNFTFLGYREYEFYESNGEQKSRTLKSTGLGVLNNDNRPAYINENTEALPHHFQEQRKKLPAVYISKTNRKSTVHRSVPMDAIAVKTYDSDGKVKGEKLFLGLFTSVTYSRSVSDVPYLRERVEEVVNMTGFIPGSHNRKAIRHILEKYPRDEIFQIRPNDLLKTALNILRLQERQRISLFMRPDSFGRYISCLVYIPRNRFRSSLRREISEILMRELNGTLTNFYTTMDDAVFARVMFTISINQRQPSKYDRDKIELMLQEAGETWPERLSEELVSALPDQSEALRLTLKYGEAFPVAYTSHYRARQSVYDLHKLEDVLQTGELALDLYRADGKEGGELRLKLYNPGRPVTLSDIMPILENMGLRVLSELPFEIKPKGTDKTIWIHDFELNAPELHGALDIETIKANFERAVFKTWYKDIENDSLNRLVVSANFNWHEVLILRSYVRYMRQIRFPYSRFFVEKTLNKNYKISALLVQLFKAYHNPAHGDLSAAKVKSLDAQIRKALEAVEMLDEDRILRSMTTLVNETVRTNYYQRMPDGTGKPYLALKINSRNVPEVPAPKPFVETFVYSPRVEAVHLRGDKVARGGLRWSDRYEDYRTEILGLMKAQMVKNALIVPMGAKGGFVVKSDIADRKQYYEEGVECYKIFIRSLLDITDNLDGDVIVPPENVVRRDGDDPYLVVAADKGTASFSDIANDISEECGFWLGDAFASGGSAGYDHKKMGITARGAWESVKMHFRALGHDTQTEPFDVIGVGDMGGDVFGNGMLLSEKIRLVGAFNHLHIFCDPNPDPAKGFKERKRLFNAVKGWDSYDTKLLSKGGMIYSRADKILTLTPEIQERFNLHKAQASPSELMQAMLRAQTDLLWFGGIGTYIKSTKESHEDAGDKANDIIRIDASELQARVIGEGANLGTTQLGRIEYSENGGLVNTDFVDNSGGVNSSDLEVNIKIMATEVMNNPKHKMDIVKRNDLLKEMTDEVADLVLRNNYQQAQAISLTEYGASKMLKEQEHFIDDLERNYGVDRSIEALPDQETIERRMRSGQGLTRPEISVILSYAKINFTNDLLNSDIPDSQDMQDWILNYFPEVLRKKFSSEILNHRLKRQIVATSMANSLINRMGPTFINRAMEKTGRSCADIAKAYIIVREVFGLRGIWDQIEALDNKVPAAVQMKAMTETSRLSEHMINWFLTHRHDIHIGKEMGTFGKHIASLKSNMDDLLTEDLLKKVEGRASQHRSEGLPEDLAHDIALIPVLTSLCDIIKIAQEREISIQSTARTYYQVGETFELIWLRDKARTLRTDDNWEAEANVGMVAELYDCQAGLSMHIIKHTGLKSGSGRDVVSKWIAEHQELMEKLLPFFTELHRAEHIELPHLVIAEQRLRNLYKT